MASLDNTYSSVLCCDKAGNAIKNLLNVAVRMAATIDEDNLVPTAVSRYIKGLPERLHRARAADAECARRKYNIRSEAEEGTQGDGENESHPDACRKTAQEQASEILAHERPDMNNEGHRRRRQKSSGAQPPYRQHKER